MNWKVSPADRFLTKLTRLALHNATPAASVAGAPVTYGRYPAWISGRLRSIKAGRNRYGQGFGLEHRSAHTGRGGRYVHGAEILTHLAQLRTAMGSRLGRAIAVVCPPCSWKAACRSGVHIQMLVASTRDVGLLSSGSGKGGQDG